MHKINTYFDSSLEQIDLFTDSFQLVTTYAENILSL